MKSILSTVAALLIVAIIASASIAFGLWIWHLLTMPT